MAKKNSSSRVASFRGKISSNDERKKRGSAFSYLNLPEGIKEFQPEVETKYVVDFMPYEVKIKNHPDRDDKNEIARKGDYWYKLPFRTHKNVGVNNVKEVCPKSFGKPCPICDERDDLRKNDGDEAQIKELNTSDRNLYVLNYKGDKKNKAGLYIYDASDFKFQETFRQQLKDEPEWDVFPHPTEGCSVKITFAEAQFGGHKYAEATRFDFVKRTEQYDDEFLDEIPNLDDCLRVLSYDQLKAKFFEAAEVDDNEDEEEEKPVKKGATKKPVKKVVEEEEEDDEPEEDEEDEDSLVDQIKGVSTVEDLLEIAGDNAEFKKHMKTLKTITKARLLKAEMLAIVEPEEEEDEPEEEEEDDEPQAGLDEQIEDAEDVPALLEIAKANPDIFKADIKELRGISKSKLLKKRMLEILEEGESLPFNKKEETPSKKQEEAPSRHRKVEEVAAKKPVAAESGKCPSGHKFGKDNDEFDECDDCPMWKPCYKKQKES